jgi:hypothetical protein
MSTTVQTSHGHHTAFEKTALALVIVALVLALASLVGTATHLLAADTTTGTGVVATAPVLAAPVLTDSAVKIHNGAVLPLETVTDAELTAYVEPTQTQLQDQPTGHLQRGPVS